MATLTLTMPEGWRVVQGGADKDKSIAAAVEDAFAHAPRDSSAVAKHWMKERLSAAFEAPDGAGADVAAVFYPTRAVAGLPLPVTGTILELDTRTEGEDDAMRTLAALAASDASAVPMPTPAGLVLRTHESRDVTNALRQEVQSSPIDDDERAVIDAAVQASTALRVRYVLPAAGNGPWHAVVFTALVETHEEGIVEMFLELFDAFSATLERSNAS